MHKKHTVWYVAVALAACLCASVLHYGYATLQQVNTNLAAKIAAYKGWGLDTKPFEAMEAQLKPWEVQKHEHIVTLAMQAYAQEVSSQRSGVSDLISYVRDRVRTSTNLTEPEQVAHLEALQNIAGEVFEKNPSLAEIKKQYALVEQEDSLVSTHIEHNKKQTIFSEIETYQEQCQSNLQFFEEKHNTDGIALANTCLTETAKLLQPGYHQNGSQFLATLVRERVYGYVQKTAEKKQQIIQDEQFALLAKKREEEKYVLVPPAVVSTGKVVVVNIGLQRLYAYQDGHSLFDYAVPVTTGKQGFETVTGQFAVYDKQRNFRMTSPFPGIYYDSVVTYWMPFYLGYGLHDAYWRSVYGTQDYPVVGSHGCVNIPLKETAILYNWVEIGTKVIVI